MRPIVSCYCEEPEGYVERFVYPMLFTPENLRRFWDESRKFRYIFTEDVRQDFRKFCELIVHEENGELVPNGLFWVVDDFVGVFYMTRITPGADADVHYSFFDRRQKGRVKLVRTMLKYVFERYQLRRVTAEIPYFASWITRNFTESIGFVKEGRKRKAIWFNDDWFDIGIYGILREEVIDGREND